MRQALLPAAFACALLNAPPVWPLEAPPLLLAQTYKADVDVSAYLASEKLDGVRAHWDGETLRFRSGNPIQAPAWFLAGLPRQPLDGELWLGRGSFERLSATVRREVPDDAEWRQIRYMVFELPGAPGTFEERAQRIEAVVAASGQPWLQAVEQFRVADRDALRRKLDEIVKAGGEGLILHRADVSYQTGRSDVLLKVKAWHDAEARVVAYIPGKGKYKGMLGALRVRSEDGREFSLGTGLSDELRRNPPPLGALVTYRYRELTGSGKPRFARFWRVRDDG